MIGKLQTLTGGLREGKALLHRFVFNGLDRISKCCLPLPFKKEPIYSGGRKGRGVGVPKGAVGISLRSLPALRVHSSHGCSPASQTTPSLGRPPAIRSMLAQPWNAYGFVPRSSSNTLSRCGIPGLQLATELLAALSSRPQRSNQQRGSWLETTARAAPGRSLMAPPSNNLPFGGHCGYSGQQLPAGRARAVPTAPPPSPTLPPAVQGHGQSEWCSFLLGTLESVWKTLCHRAVAFLGREMGGGGAALHRQEEKAWQCFRLHKIRAAVHMY